MAEIKEAMIDSSSRRIVRSCFIVLAWLFAASITVQVFFAGLALFVDSTHWATHISFARYFGFLPLMMAVLAWSGRLSLKTILRCIGLFGMMIGMFLTALFSSQIGGLSALHPIIALMLFWSSTEIIRSFRRTIH